MKKSWLERARVACEVLGGLRPVPGEAPAWVDVVLPFWWCLLLFAAIAFGGAGVKFAYIDF